MLCTNTFSFIVITEIFNYSVDNSPLKCIKRMLELPVRGSKIRGKSYYIGRWHLKVMPISDERVIHRESYKRSRKKTYESYKSPLSCRKRVLNFLRLVSSEPKETLYNGLLSQCDDSTHYLLKIHSFYQGIVSSSISEKQRPTPSISGHRKTLRNAKGERERDWLHRSAFGW